MHLLLICTSLLFTCLVQAEEPPALNAGQAFRQQLQGQAKLLISEHYGDLLARWPHAGKSAGGARHGTSRAPW